MKNKLLDKLSKFFTTSVIIFVLLIGGYLWYGNHYTHQKADKMYNNIVLGSYWGERCIEENNYDAFIYGTPGAQWCIVNGQFTTARPTRDQFYHTFYSSNSANYGGNYFMSMYLWPVDMITTKALGGLFSWPVG